MGDMFWIGESKELRNPHFGLLPSGVETNKVVKFNQHHTKGLLTVGRSVRNLTLCSDLFTVHGRQVRIPTTSWGGALRRIVPPLPTTVPEV